MIAALVSVVVTQFVTVHLEASCFQDLLEAGKRARAEVVAVVGLLTGESG